MTGPFTHDVFLSHSSRDKSVVRALAERLRGDGLRVWIDEWEIQVGDSIPAKIEEGLERSRLLLLCMSGDSFGSDWAALESQTFRFRDPLNKERRFVPLRLDDTPAKGSLAQFLYVDWRPHAREAEYPKLIAACRPPGEMPVSQEPPKREGLEAKVLSLGHTNAVQSVAFSPDGRWALSASDDKTVRLWEVETGRCLRVLEGHSSSVYSVSWAADGLRALSGSNDNTVRLWEVETSRCLRVLEGHSHSVWSVSMSADGLRALSGSHDKTVRLWEVETGRCLRVLEGHSHSVRSVSMSADGRRALSGSEDKTVRLWEVETGRCLRVLEGHSDWVRSVSMSADGRRALSGSDDKTVRLWEVETGRCLRVLEGHSHSVWSVSMSADGRRALSGSEDKTVRLWEVETGRCLRVLEGHSDWVRSVSMSADGLRALSGSDDNTVRLWEVETGRYLRVLEGNSGWVQSVSMSTDGLRALSGSDDDTVRLWEVETGRCLRVLEGHSGNVWSVSWSADGLRALSGSADKTVRLWGVESGRCLRVLEGHSDTVWSVSMSADGLRALSASSDKTVRVWEVETGRCLRVLEGHSNSVLSVSISADGLRVLSGSYDKTVRLWEVETGRCLRVLEGHSDNVWSVSMSVDGLRALSGSGDKTVRLWEVETGRCLRVLEGHSNNVWSVSMSANGLRALSGSSDHTVRLWDVETGRCLRVLKGHSDSVLRVSWSADGQRAFSVAANGVMREWNLRELLREAPARSSKASAAIAPPIADQLQYTNAKVLLVGDSGTGKTGLSMRLAHDTWKESDSTVGAWATQWRLDVAAAGPMEREIWLWDFGGQADQRLIHQLFMDETALAVLVFDAQKEDLLETLGQWDRDLSRASRRPFRKLLAAGRVDTGSLRVSRDHVDTFAKERGFSDYIETSAKTGKGCPELKDAIAGGIDWDAIPWRSSPLLFKRLKDEILRVKDQGRVLLRLNELREALELRLTGETERFTDDQLRAVVGLLAGPGAVWELKFGSWVLLQPERINAYAQAVIATLNEDKLQRGCILEEKVLRGELAYTASMARLPEDEERIVLLAMLQTLVERGLCLRSQDERGKSPTLLIFPSYYRRERPDLEGHPAVFVSYRFHGFLDDIYATLVVRLHHTEPFEQDKLWRYAADFNTPTGKRLGVKLTRRAEGAGELELYFDPSISLDEKIIFSRYVHEHLQHKGRDVERFRHYVCPQCGWPVRDREKAMQRLAQGRKDILCVSCEERVPLWDALEERFCSPEIRAQVQKLEQQSSAVLDNESRERILVGEVVSTVALAGQICREFSVSDHGIDMEIEFKSDAGDATGKKLYLQLKSGDSHLRRRARDEAEVFTIKDPRHAEYWMSQAFPVLLVVRSSDGTVRWMDISEWLKRATEGAKKSVRQIVFEGERFDVMSVRRWRDRALARNIKPG